MKPERLVEIEAALANPHLDQLEVWAGGGQGHQGAFFVRGHDVKEVGTAREEAEVLNNVVRVARELAKEVRALGGLLADAEDLNEGYRRGWLDGQQDFRRRAAGFLVTKGMMSGSVAMQQVAVLAHDRREA